MPEIETSPAPQNAENQNPPSNERATESVPDTKNNLLERIRGATGAVFEKYKIGRGRPRKDGAPKKSDVPVPGAAPAAPAAASPAPLGAAPVNPSGSVGLRRVVVSAVKGAKGIARFILKGKAEQAGFEKKFVEEKFEQAKPSDEAWRNFEESTGALLAKYNASTKYDVELVWATDLANLFSCDVLLFKTFDAEIRRRNAEKARREEQ